MVLIESLVLMVIALDLAIKLQISLNKAICRLSLVSSVVGIKIRMYRLKLEKIKHKKTSQVVLVCIELINNNNNGQVVNHSSVKYLTCISLFLVKTDIKFFLKLLFLSISDLLSNYLSNICI